VIRSEEQEESRELHLMVDAYNGPKKQGDFLRSFAEAFMRADPGNFELLRPVAAKLIEKYDLKCTCPAGEPDNLEEREALR